MLALALLNLIALFVPLDLSLYSFCAASVVFISGISLMGAGFKKITITFSLAGVILLFYLNVPVSVWIAAINSMSNIISIMVIMLLFTIPIEAGGYAAAVKRILTRSFKGESSLYIFSTVTTHIMSSFLLFGTIPVMISLLGDTLECSVANYERFVATAISRGYGLAVLWAPGAINLLLVTQATGVGWAGVMIPGVILSFLGFFTSYLVESKYSLSTVSCEHSSSVHSENPNIKADQYKAYHILAVVFGLICITLLLDHFKFGSSPQRVMLAGAIVVFAWMALLVRQSDFTESMRNYWAAGILKIVDLAPLFIAMGIFSAAVQKSELISLIRPELQTFVNCLGGYALIVLPMLTILCAIIGIHPFISIVMLGQILASLKLPVSHYSLAVGLALGGSISYITSPFAGIVLTLGKFVNCKPVDVALRWNFLYSTLLFAEGIILAYVWGYYFG